jgi:protease IV
MDFSNPFGLLGSLARRRAADEEVSGKPQIALIYAEGIIIDGESEDGIFGPADAIGSENMRKALRIAARDENIKAIVIRIDSPGGSALASEVMWQAVRRAGREKPVIISIGGMAASGGYYLACAGDHIFADPTAVIGSIGVVGGKFVLKDLFDKVGLRTESFARGSNAGLFSSTEPFTDPQRRLVTSWMQRTYDQFVDRIMLTRKDKIKDIDDVAHGRIFLARQARQLGLIDDLGGMEKALAHAADKAKLKPGEYDVRIVPATRTLGDLLMGSDPDAIAAIPFRPQVSVGPDSILRALSPSTSRQLRQQIQILRLLQDRPVMLVSPYIITIR